MHSLVLTRPPIGLHSLELARSRSLSRTRSHLLSLACPAVGSHSLDLAVNMPFLLFKVDYWVLHCIVQCKKLCHYPKELDNNCLFLTHICTCTAVQSSYICICFLLPACIPVSRLLVMLLLNESLYVLNMIEYHQDNNNSSNIIIIVIAWCAPCGV